MLLAISPSEAREWIREPELIREDRIIPGDFPAAPNSPYAENYDWLFIYERRIAAFLEPWLKRFRYELIGHKGILCEALSNAFFHAHQKDSGKPIVVRVLLGKAGLMVDVEDCGPGFPVQNVYNRFCEKKCYFSSAGNGTRLMAENPNFGVFHSASGRIFHLLHLFAGNLAEVADGHIIDRKIENQDLGFRI